MEIMGLKDEYLKIFCGQNICFMNNFHLETNIFSCCLKIIDFPTNSAFIISVCLVNYNNWEINRCCIQFSPKGKERNVTKVIF